MNNSRAHTGGWLLVAFALLALACCAIALAVVLHQMLTTLLLTAGAIALVTAGVQILGRWDRAR